MDKKRYWFKRKRYGWGFTPSTWQGWVVVVGYVVVIVAMIPAFLDAPEAVERREAALFFLFTFLATFGLVKICFLKGPAPRWRWGRKPGDNPEEDF